ncbi:MAG: AraC family transcriptional regulator, partial [Opitutaceae bacterium]|nr:AraC family transcriptional regulator [Opitutaceae bacterium]
EHLGAWLVRSGNVTARVGSLTLRARAGDWLIPPTGDLWREFSPDARILSVRFRVSWPTGEALFKEGIGLVFPADECPELEKSARPLARFAAKNFPNATRFLMDERATLAEHLRLQTLFTRWLDVFSEAMLERGVVPARMGRIDARVLHAVRIIERRALSAPLTENELAREVGVSVSQLSRLFIRQFGISPHDYFDRRRHEHALDSLLGTPQAVKEIAFELGFSSLPHFSAWFRRRHGVSPRELRSRSASEGGLNSIHQSAAYNI